MGNHLSLMDREGNNHPEWDRVRTDDDRPFMDIMREFPLPRPAYYQGHFQLFRPELRWIPRIEERLAEAEHIKDKSRYFKLLRLLDRESEQVCPTCGQRQPFRWWLEYA